MSKLEVLEPGLFLMGWMFLGAACALEVDEPEDEVVEERAEAVDIRVPHPRLRLPNPIDRNRRFLHCLPDPRKSYIAKDPEICAGIRFYCADGAPFFDACGCGCETRFSGE